MKWPLALLSGKWAIAAGAIAIAAGAAWHLHRTQAAHQAGLQAGRAQVQAQWDAERARQHQAAAEAAQQNQQKKEQADARVITAQNQRTQTSARMAGDLRRLADERDRLRHDLTTALNTIARCDLPAATAHASADRAAAIAELLADMERTGAEMARAADAHAADALMYQNAWPR